MSDADSRGVPGGGMRSTGPTADLWPPADSWRPTIVGEHHLVSAGHPLVADAACRVFECGGNAIDAGVAAGLAANVVQADMCNLGGVAPLLVRTAHDNRVWSVGGLGRWGEQATLETHLLRFQGDMPAGAGCAVVPAAVAAWVVALRRFGSLDFADVAAPAIEYARDGFTLDQRTAESLEICGRTFSAWESSRVIYWPHGRPPRVGERIVQSDLGRLLARLIEAERDALGRGSDRDEALDAVHREFYEGEVAQTIVDFVDDGGGFMTLEDLASFEAEVVPAVSGEYGGWSISVNDTWTQGPALLQALAILEGFELSSMEHNGDDYIHLLSEAIKLAFSDRERYYGDPRHVDVPLEWLLSPKHADELRALIKSDAALPNLPTLRGATEVPPSLVEPRRRLDTTNLCTIDADGNAFSATISDTLDGSPVVPGLGILVSPRGVQSRLDPLHVAALGPGRRPRLTPAPVLALRREVVGVEPRVWAIGCPGGDVILQGVLQTFLNVVEFGMTPQQAVEAPRVGCFSYPDSFFPNVEVLSRVCVEEGISELAARRLAERGHDVVRWPRLEFDAGGVSMVLDLESPQPANRVLAAAGDPRRSCYAIGR